MSSGSPLGLGFGRGLSLGLCRNVLQNNHFVTFGLNPRDRVRVAIGVVVTLISSKY